MKPMRLKAVLRETWRNVATGTSRCALISLLLSICAVACMCADLTQMTGLIGDARKWKESGASTYAITLQGGIDGAACEGLRSANGVLGAAALRQSSDRVRIASLPATEIPTYEASAHVAQVFAATGIRKDNSGVIMSTAVARTYGAHAGTVLPLVGGARMRVSATFDWPSDGRQPTYGYAIISPGNDTKAYDTCLVRAWPVPDGIESLLRVSIRADAESGVGAAASSTSAGTSGSNETPHAKISRINTMLGSHMPGPADFDARITRYAPLLMFVIAMALGFASVCMRRIEIASALHAGYPKTAMLLQLFLETLATVAASCVACLPVVAIVPLILTGSVTRCRLSRCYAVFRAPCRSGCLPGLRLGV